MDNRRFCVKSRGILTAKSFHENRLVILYRNDKMCRANAQGVSRKWFGDLSN